MRPTQPTYFLVLALLALGLATLQPALADSQPCGRDVTRTGSDPNWTYSSTGCYGDCPVPSCHQHVIELGQGYTNEWCVCGDDSVPTWCKKVVHRDNNGTILAVGCAPGQCSTACSDSWSAGGVLSCSCP
jgi:hypothetical protein